MSESALEAILLMATEPITAGELSIGLGVPEAVITQRLSDIAQFYEEHQRGIRLGRIAGGWRFHTAESEAAVIEDWLVGEQRSKLSQAALETLAVIAYQQPISRGRVSAVRGVNVDGVVRTLIVRGLIEEDGNDPITGATNFATTGLFLQKLGLDSLDELPDLAPMLPDAVALEAELGELANQPRAENGAKESSNG